MKLYSVTKILVRFFLATLAILALQGSASASTLTLQDLRTIPNPNLLGGGIYVSDVAEVITPADEQDINTSNEALYQAKAAQVVVATIARTDCSSSFDFSYELFNKWAIGNKDRDDGTLLFLCSSPTPGASKIEIRTGKGMEGYLPDPLLGQMIDEQAMPYFREGDLSKGLLTLSNAIVSTIENDGTYESVTDVSGAEAIGVVVIILFFVIVFILLVAFGGAIESDGTYTSSSSSYRSSSSDYSESSSSSRSSGGSSGGGGAGGSF